MMSVTLARAARNVLMDLLFHFIKRQEHQNKIANPVQKVTVEMTLFVLIFPVPLIIT